MHARVRFALWLAFVAVVVSASRQAAADYPDRYGRMSPEATSPAQQVPPETPSSWPSAPAPVPSGGNPPRLLPVPNDRYQSPPLPAGEVRPAGGFAAKPVSAETKAPKEPLPLSRKDDTAASPLTAGDLPPLVSTAGSLGLVIGLFLVVVWVVRRGMPKGNGLLPSDAVEVLGRAPLVGRQQVHLVRCGNKLVLVTITPTGTQTLTEITEPAEVARLLNLCQPGAPAGSFRAWLGQFTHARGPDYRERPDAVDFHHLETGHHGS